MSNKLEFLKELQLLINKYQCTIGSYQPNYEDHAVYIDFKGQYVDFIDGIYDDILQDKIDSMSEEK